jgi:DNA-nicking Smr family endonuclease
MRPSKSSLTLKSFEKLKVLLKGRSFPPCPPRSDDHHNDGARNDAGNDERLFIEAMEDVTPLIKDNHSEKLLPVTLPCTPHCDSTAEVLSDLSNLVNRGEGLILSDTPEYVEGTGYNVSPRIAKRLHRGDFAIDAHLDLHGCKAKDAKEIFDQFLKDIIRTGKRGALIIHGRGLCSPSEPVLKAKVVEWLTRGHWRKWVVAFASARSCDGGTGATYILLRRRALTKRFRKGHKAGTGQEGS